MKLHRLYVAAACTAGLLAAQNQRQFTNLTTALTQHEQATISPDGNWIAHLQPGGLAVLPAQGGATVIVARNPTPTSFVWSPDSQALYFTVGGNVSSVPRIGGQSTPLASTGGPTVLLAAVDATNARLYGTRNDSPVAMQHVVEVGTTPGSSVTSLVTTSDAIANVCLDPSGAYVGYSAQTGTGGPIRFWRIDRNGQNPIDMTGASVGTLARDAFWVDAGDRIAFVGRDASNVVQVLSIDRRTRSVVPLTANASHARVRVSTAARWILCEAPDPLGGNGPGLMPLDGGGIVYLYFGQRFTYTGWSTIDAAGTKVVTTWSTSGQWPQVVRFDLDGEMRVFPRAERGRVLNFELPAALNEVGVIFLGLATGNSLGLPGVGFDFVLDANFAILAIQQGGPGNVTANLPIPNLAPLAGLRLAFQGMRYDPVAQLGEFTRFGAFTIF